MDLKVISQAVLSIAFILVFGNFIIMYIMRILKKALSKSHLDKSFISFLLKFVRIVLYVLLVMTALSSIGVSITGILTAMSAVAVAVALALKDSLSNVAGGIILLISPRFYTGDVIETDSLIGIVLDVDLMHTTIRTPDNKQISIPNGMLVNNEIINYSREDHRRVEIIIPISYETDVEIAKGIIKNTVVSHELVDKEKEDPFVRVSSYGESSVNIVVRCWCKNENYRTVLFDLTEQTRADLKKSGIDMPYNQLVIHTNK